MRHYGDMYARAVDKRQRPFRFARKSAAHCEKAIDVYLVFMEDQL